MGELSKELKSTSPLAVQTKECFIVVPLHDRFKWNGPFDTKAEAQREAAQWIMQTGWLSVGVFQIVGTVTKPVPNLEWHEPDAKG